MQKKLTIKEKFQIFRELDDSRAPITKNILYLSFSAAFASALFYAYSPTISQSSFISVLNVFALLVLSISTSVTAAALVDLFFRMREDARIRWDQSVFRALFDCELDTNSVAIVIPQYYAGNDKSVESAMERVIPEPPPVDFTDWKIHEVAATEIAEYKDIALSDVYSASFCDIVAASRLIAAFAENKLPIPDIIWDTDIENRLKNSHYKTFIAIGLFSNQLTARLNKEKSLPERLFRFQVGSKTSSVLYEYCRILLQWPGKSEESWNEFKVKSRTPSGIPDVAVFAKVPFQGKSVLVCGGTTAEATQKLGGYIYEKWQDINLWQDDFDAHQTVGTRSWYAIAFEVNVYGPNSADNIQDVSKRGVRVMTKS